MLQCGKMRGGSDLHAAALGRDLRAGARALACGHAACPLYGATRVVTGQLLGTSPVGDPVAAHSSGWRSNWAATGQ